jgi:hypothetical protein
MASTQAVHPQAGGAVMMPQAEQPHALMNRVKFLASVTLVLSIVSMLFGELQLER